MKLSSGGGLHRAREHTTVFFLSYALNVGWTESSRWMPQILNSVTPVTTHCTAGSARLKSLEKHEESGSLRQTFLFLGLKLKAPFLSLHLEELGYCIAASLEIVMFPLFSFLKCITLWVDLL